MKKFTTGQIEIDITPEQVAVMFASMDNKEQADFFNTIAELVEDWEHPFCLQLQYITDEPTLSDGARKIMQEIGLYSSKKSE